MSEPRPAFHRLEDGVYVPTGLGLSPWDKRSQSGVSLAGLVVHALETVPTQAPMMTARITIDIIGTVPMAALTPVVRTLRDGPRMQLIEAELQAEGRTWVRASALRARLGESPVIDEPLTHPLPALEADRGRTNWVEAVRTHGGAPGEGAGGMWVKLNVDAVAGEPLTPLQRLAIVADFGSGTAPVVDWKQWTSANMDIAVHMTRPPRGDWLLADSRCESAGNGIGIVRTRMGDADGMFATTLQTMFLNRR